MPAAKPGFRLLLFVSIGALAVCIAPLAILAYPQPMFPYGVVQGRLALYADQPFDAQHAGTLLADIERRLLRSPLNDDHIHRIFIVNSEWRRRLTLLWNYRAAGVNYYPLTRNVFIRLADIDTDRVLTTAGAAKAVPRTLAYYAAHEIGHSLLKQRLSWLEQLRLPRWINEGVADDIGFADVADIDGLTRAWRDNDPDLDPQRSGHYDRFRLLVLYFTTRQHWSTDELLTSRMPQSEAERIFQNRDIRSRP